MRQRVWVNFAAVIGCWVTLAALASAQSSAPSAAPVLIGQPEQVGGPPPPPTPQPTPMASAYSTALDSVVFREGGSVVGHILSIEPNVRIVIQDGNGPRSIAWNDIATASGPSVPGGAINLARADLSPERLRVPSPGRYLTLFESTGNPLAIGVVTWELTQFNGLGGRERHVIGGHDDLCVTPCSLYLPSGETRLYVGGHGQRAAEVSVPVAPPGARVRLWASSSRVYGLSAAGLPMGLVTGIIGALIAAFSTHDTEAFAIGFGIAGGGLSTVVLSAFGLASTHRPGIADSRGLENEPPESARAEH